MAIKTYMESSLGTSEVFQLFNNMDGEKVLQKRALDLIKTAKKITSEDIEAAYITVRQIVEGLTRAAMKAFDEERVILLYNNDPAKSMLQAVPFITFTVGGQPKTYVFVDKYITVSRDGVMQIQSPIFRDLLIAGTIANGIRRDYSNLANNQYLMKILMEVYDEFFTRIINRDYSIAADKKMFDTIRYWINRFFLEHVYGANDSD